jgi:peptide chain release factor 1
MFDKLEKVVARYSELADLLSKPEVTNDTNQYRKLTKEYADLQELVETFAEYKTRKKALKRTDSYFLILLMQK